jgi:hypothetical protein
MMTRKKTLWSTTTPESKPLSLEMASLHELGVSRLHVSSHPIQAVTRVDFALTGKDGTETHTVNIDSHGTTEWAAELWTHAEELIYQQNKTLASPVRGHRAQTIIVDDIRPTLMSKARKSSRAQPGLYYIDSYVSLVNEIEEITSNSRAIADQHAAEELGELPKRLYFHLYQRLHSYGGFEWDTNNFGTNPNP